MECIQYEVFGLSYFIGKQRRSILANSKVCFRLRETFSVTGKPLSLQGVKLQPKLAVLRRKMRVFFNKSFNLYFVSIKNRKKVDRTSFLDLGKRILIERMEESDRKPSTK